MDLATLELDPVEAKERLAEYQGLIASERTAEDTAIAMGYRAAARGLPVISLSTVMAAGGWFDSGLPRLAIVRADAIECRVDVSRWRDAESWHLVFGDIAEGWKARSNRGALVGAHTVRVAVPRPSSDVCGLKNAGSTIVPIIPPRHRPKPRRLRHTHILWEVEEWKPVAPKDPALLRHIRGDLWAVLAVWDLTELERLVLTQRT